MKKVLFIMKYPLEEQYSIKQKLDGQMSAVFNMGYEVYYISFDKENLYLNHRNERKIIQKTRFGKSNMYYHLITFYDIYDAARKVILQEDFYCVYFRYGPLNESGNRLFKVAHEKSTLVVEIPTFPTDRERQKTIIRRAYMKYSDMWWKKCAKYITLFTLIGEKAESYLGVPAINIDNGVSVGNIPLRKVKKSPDGKIHVLAVASMCRWHGYDRFIKGLSNWNSSKKNDLVLDMVGDEGDGSLYEWKKLVQDLNLTDQVIFHGRMTGESLTEMFENATIGLCSLAMARTGFNTGSVLKLREYMARGLPFIYAHDDPDIFPEMPWCMKIDNNETPVEMDEVNNFVNRVINNPELCTHMREYAFANMTWEAQFKKVFSMLEERK